MAETQQDTAESQPLQMPAQPAKRPVGRPRKYPLPEEPGDEAPRPGEDGSEDTDFFAWIKTFEPAGWNEQLTLSLYRTHPLIDLGKKGDWKIERYNKPVDAQDIMQSHGSGGYKILLTRWDPTNGKTTLLRTHYFKVLNMHYPPRVPFGAWLDRKENEEWQWARQALQDQNKGATAGAPALTESPMQLFRDAVQAVKELRPDQSPEEQTTLAALVIETMKDNQKQMLSMANPTQMLTVVDKILTAVKPKDETSGVMAMFTAQLNLLQAQLTEERKANRELLTKLLSNDGTPKRSLKEELLDLKEVGEAIGMSFGRGAAAKTSTDWGGVLLEVGKEVVKQVGTLGAAMMSRGMMPRPNPAMRPPGAPTQQAQPAPAPGLPPADATPQPIPNQEEQISMLQQIANQYGELFDKVAPFLVDHFAKNFSGMEFREWFLETYGTFAYNHIRQMSKETLAGVLELRKQQAPAHVQELLAQLQPADKVLTFVEEFLSDRPADEEEDEPEPDAAAALEETAPNRANEEF